MVQQLFMAFVFSSLFLSNITFGLCPLQDGDIIFVKNQSHQAELLMIASGSDWSHVGMAFKRNNSWEVIEAVFPVKWSSLYDFMKGSRDLAFKVRRPNFPFDSQKVKKFAESKLGIDYDLIFAWDDERLYCTELVWKAYKETTGYEIGTLKKVGDLNIYNDRILTEAQSRFQEYGIPFDLEKWKTYDVITPIDMLNAKTLDDSLDVLTLGDFRGCI